MASRPELYQIAQELEIEDYDELLIEELTEQIRESIDKKFNVKLLVGINDMSDTLVKFMVKEYDYRLYDKDNNEIDYKEIIK